jgi:hypothetical protein
MKILLFITVTFLAFLTATPAHAVCPLCTIVIGAGLGFSRYLGIDDLITGIWLGGFITSMGLWSANTLLKWKVPHPKVVGVVFFYVFTMIFLWIAKLIGLPDNTVFGVDRLVFGSIIGLLVFLSTAQIDVALRKSNEGKVYIYYQKVLLPMLFLSLVSYVAYVIIG